MESKLSQRHDHCTRSTLRFGSSESALRKRSMMEEGFPLGLDDSRCDANQAAGRCSADDVNRDVYSTNSIDPDILQVRCERLQQPSVFFSRQPVFRPLPFVRGQGRAEEIFDAFQADGRIGWLRSNAAQKIRSRFVRLLAAHNVERIVGFAHPRQSTRGAL
jgi:hypothetical protein